MYQVSSKRRSPRQPTTEFHMSTRRRASIATPSMSSQESSSIPQIGSQPRPVTPEPNVSSSPAGSSPLSTPPASLGPPPEGLTNLEVANKQSHLRELSPTGRPSLLRKAKSTKVDYNQESPVSNSALKRKSSDDDDFIGEDAETKSVNPNAGDRHNLKRAHVVPPLPEVQIGQIRPRLTLKRKAFSGSSTKPYQKRASLQESVTDGHHELALTKAPELNLPGLKPKRAAIRGRKPKKHMLKEVFEFKEYKDKLYWPEYDPKNPVFYGADAQTRYHAGSQRTPSANGSPKKSGRGGRGGRGRGRGGGNFGGRGRGKGLGRDGRGDSPDYPREKPVLTEAGSKELEIRKERRAELKRFFAIVGAQNIEALDIISTRDINKLVKKPKAHRQVPEYDKITAELEERKQDAIELAQRRYEIQRQLAEEELAQDKEVLLMQFKTRVENAYKEHLFGAQSDLMRAKQATAAANDDTRTEDGSDADYFPQYHPLPELGTHVRGYNSMRIDDEAAFRHQLASYDDQIRREVIDDDIMAPIAKAADKSNKLRKEEQARQKTQNMAALSGEAIGRLQQLSKINGYLIPRPIYDWGNTSYGLSLVADAADIKRRQEVQEKAYIFMPLPAGETFPVQALNYDPLPSQQKPQQQPQPQPQPQHQAPVPPPPTPATRRQQFIFQPPQGTTQQPRPPTQMTQQRFPVQFVNQTIASRKASAGGKGQPRMLLPKT